MNRPEGPSRSTLAGYLSESARPLVSLAFVVPMLVVYEGGLLALGPQAIRNGAEMWLRRLLEEISFGQYFLLPLLTCGILLAWHHMTRQPWRFAPTVLYGMLFESALFGFLLLALAQVQGAVFHSALGSLGEVVGGSSAAALGDSGGTELLCATGPGGVDQSLRRAIGYMGAGLYEELLFRLMLLPAVTSAVRMAGATQRASLIAAVLVTSLIFSGAHFQLFTGHGEPFHWFAFFFRFLAGGFFAVLFVNRGFGITAGSHALYDVFVGLF